MIWKWIRGAGLGSEDYGNTLATASLNPPWDVAWRIKLAPFLAETLYFPRRQRCQLLYAIGCNGVVLEDYAFSQSV
jgi:hypothetical protein